VEPSLLIFQSDLCIALIKELERRFGNKLQLNFESRVVSCDLNRKTISVEKKGAASIAVEEYDLLVGSDGVHSVIRSAIKDACPKFTVKKEALPGEFKVARLKAKPPKVDPDAVSLMLPKQGVTAGVIPTINGDCSILFASLQAKENDILTPSRIDDKEAVTETLLQSYPRLNGTDMDDIAEQLVTQKPGIAYSVVCDAYHYGDAVALVGDAAHAGKKMVKG
jgi:2-polyprenyl-6-methoxyphenol hydroxylase-like FAD-dependent oxidoreductase